MHKIFLLTDSHLGHQMLIDEDYRPEGFDDKILSNMGFMGGNDILIHLGDVCIGNDEYWHGILTSFGCKMILVRGNHDNKSDTWYYAHGWDFVCDAFQLNKFGKKILFSHEPIPNHGLDLNIHGHWHGNDHRIEAGFSEWYDDSYKALALEDTDYKPVDLRKFINQ